MKVIAIVGYHNSGKTTLTEEVANILRGKGLKVGYIKHDPKGHGRTDKEGSDTDRVFKVSDRVALISPEKTTLWDRREDDLEGVLKEFFKGFDVVLVEGYKGYKGIPKVAVGDVEAESVVLRVSGVEEADRVVEFINSMEDNL